MHTSRSTALRPAAALCAVALLSLAGLPLIASADPSPAASPSPSAASASAAPTGSSPSPSASAGGFWGGDPPDDAATPSPKEDEWANAKEVGPISGINSACKGTHVREHIRIRCTGVGHSIEQILGKPDGFRASIEPPRADGKGGWIEPPHYFQFSLRKGDRKLFEYRSKGLGNYDSEWSPNSAEFWSAVWIEGEEPLLAHK
jgi:hypothetical protein